MPRYLFEYRSQWHLHPDNEILFSYEVSHLAAVSKIFMSGGVGNLVAMQYRYGYPWQYIIHTQHMLFQPIFMYNFRVLLDKVCIMLFWSYFEKRSTDTRIISLIFKKLLKLQLLFLLFFALFLYFSLLSIFIEYI